MLVIPNITLPFDQILRDMIRKQFAHGLDDARFRRYVEPIIDETVQVFKDRIYQRDDFPEEIKWIAARNLMRYLQDNPFDLGDYLDDIKDLHELLNRNLDIESAKSYAGISIDESLDFLLMNPNCHVDRELFLSCKKAVYAYVNEGGALQNLENSLNEMIQTLEQDSEIRSEIERLHQKIDRAKKIDIVEERIEILKNKILSSSNKNSSEIILLMLERNLEQFDSIVNAKHLKRELRLNALRDILKTNFLTACKVYEEGGIWLSDIAEDEDEMEYLASMEQGVLKSIFNSFDTQVYAQLLQTYYPESQINILLDAYDIDLNLPYDDWVNYAAIVYDVRDMLSQEFDEQALIEQFNTGLEQSDNSKAFMKSNDKDLFYKMRKLEPFIKIASLIGSDSEHFHQLNARYESMKGLRQQLAHYARQENVKSYRQGTENDLGALFPGQQFAKAIQDVSQLMADFIFQPQQEPREVIQGWLAPRLTSDSVFHHNALDPVISDAMRLMMHQWQDNQDESFLLGAEALARVIIEHEVSTNPQHDVKDVIQSVLNSVTDLQSQQTLLLHLKRDNQGLIQKTTELAEVVDKTERVEYESIITIREKIADAFESKDMQRYARRLDAKIQLEEAIKQDQASNREDLLPTAREMKKKIQEVNQPSDIKEPPQKTQIKGRN